MVGMTRAQSSGKGCKTMTNKAMTVGVLFCASLLFSGCYELLGISTGGESLDAMLSKTALPPGVST